MKDRQTVLKAFRQAVSNGLDIREEYDYWFYVLSKREAERKDFNVDDKLFIYGMIFTHEFAKAFWGDKKLSDILILKARRGRYTYPPISWTTKDDCFIWEYHLQQMVLEEDPISYLRKYMEDERIYIDRV